jgi:hypothetical protein
MRASSLISDTQMAARLQMQDSSCIKLLNLMMRLSQGSGITRNLSMMYILRWQQQLAVVVTATAAAEVQAVR